jgi:HK97 family phage major capsid protein
MSYLDNWFIRNAILTENAAIFADLKAGYNGGTVKAIAGWKAFKKSITKDLDPSALYDGVIATNQSGFAALDEEEDANGRPILQPNPANPTQKLFQGLVVKVYPDAQLPNIDGTHFPVFYGDTKAGATFKENTNLEFNVSEHFLFNKNQNCLRAIEGYDVMSTDTSAYIYGSFTATVKA